jgi:hypothetical protein
MDTGTLETGVCKRSWVVLELVHYIFLIIPVAVIVLYFDSFLRDLMVEGRFKA